MRTIALLLALLLVGCDVNSVEFNTPPAPEVPVVNLPVLLRQQNWASKTARKAGQGSCVHASTIMLFNWRGEYEWAAYWRKKHSGGETSVSITQFWKSEGFKYKSTLDEKTYECSGDPEFLKECSLKRLGCIIWYKPSHCCFFTGFCEIKGKHYASIIDNNAISGFEYVPADEFIMTWRKCGGFAATITDWPPASPLPWPVVRSKK